MKIILSLLTILIALSTAKAQDMITLKNGDQIKCKVIEVGVTEVKYKKENLPDAAVYVIDKSTVFLINYENGDKDVVNSIGIEKTMSEEKSYKNRGLSCFVSIAPMPIVGSDFIDTNKNARPLGNTILNMESSFGYQFNSYFYLGCGLGIDSYDQYIITSIYADPRITMMKGKYSPILAIHGGYGMEPKAGNFFGGISLGFEPGVKIFLGPKTALEVLTGYRQQFTNITSSGRIQKINSLNLRAGFQF